MREPKGKEIAPKIIHEDEDLLVIDKPAGWVVNDAVTTKAPTIQEWLKNNFQFSDKVTDSVVNFQECRNGIVHRLDKETSGVLLVAKTKESFDYLQGLFKERKVKKSYIALLHGRVEPKEGEIEAEVGRLPWNRRRFGVLPGGRYSKTKYKVKEEYVIDKDVFSLVDFSPETGRTHQIRIHAKHIGHPIVGDEFYAGRKTARKDRKWCPRLFLHASRISFKHPSHGEVDYESSLPDDLKEVLATLNL